MSLVLERSQLLKKVEVLQDKVIRELLRERMVVKLTDHAQEI
jgi:hypothetical protein